MSGFDDLVNIKISDIRTVEDCASASFYFEKEIFSKYKSDNEQMGQIIALVKEQFETENKYTIDLRKEIAMKELLKRGYNEDKIKEWIEYIE